jgi:hypothetical protein
MLTADTRARAAVFESLKVVGAMLAVQGLLVFFGRNLDLADFMLVTTVLVVVRVLLLLSKSRHAAVASSSSPPGAR